MKRITNNTKETAPLIRNYDDFFEQKKIYKWNFYVQFYCEKCGKLDTKTDTSIYSMINNHRELWCGPCLRKEGTLKNHGSETWNNVDKNKKTCLERYGVDNGSKRPDIILYISKNNKASEPETRNKYKKTCLERYGVDNVAKSDQAKLKMEQTNIERYGCKAPAQNSNILKICPRFKSIRYAETYFDSSWEISFWLWCEKNSIKIERNYKGYNLLNGHKCYPDFIINSRLVEIKGNHLMKRPDYIFKNLFYKEHNVLVFTFNDLIDIFAEIKPIVESMGFPIPKIPKSHIINGSNINNIKNLLTSCF